MPISDEIEVLIDGPASKRTERTILLSVRNAPTLDNQVVVPPPLRPSRQHGGQPYDVVLHGADRPVDPDKPFVCIKRTNKHYDALLFPLIFPLEEPGWTIGRTWNGRKSRCSISSNFSCTSVLWITRCCTSWANWSRRTWSSNSPRSRTIAFSTTRSTNLICVKTRTRAAPTRLRFAPTSRWAPLGSRAFFRRLLLAATDTCSNATKMGWLLCASTSTLISSSQSRAIQHGPQSRSFMKRSDEKSATRYRQRIAST